MNKRQVGAITALVLLFVASSTSTADSFSLEDPILPNAAVIAKLPAIPGVLMTAKHQLATERSVDAGAPAGAIGKLEIKAQDIVAPASITSGRLTISPRKVSSVQILTIDGQVFELVPIDQTIDEKFGLRVVTMRVLNMPESYARFTVAMDGAVVGTLVTPKIAYRIASVEPGKQLIYRLAPDKATQLRSAAQENKLERRHVQLEQLAAIGPDTAHSSEQGGSLVLIGGRLGKVPQGKITPATLEPILRKVSDLAFRSAMPDIRITYVIRRPAGGRIEFEQMIDGIPVLAKNVVVLAGDGAVLELRTKYVDPARAKSYQPSIDLKQAVKIAQEALEKHLQKKLASVHLLNEARFRYRATSDSNDLVLEYELDVSTQRDGNWIVTIDAYDGKAVVQDAAMYGTVYGYRVCNGLATTATDRPKCNAGTTVVWTSPPGGTATCPFRDPHSGGTICNDREYAAAHLALSKADNLLAPIDAANPAYCCDKLGGPPDSDHIIDINVSTSWGNQTTTAYDRGTGTIHSGVSEFGPRNYEVVWHELGHHVVHRYNMPIANAGTNLGWFEGLFNEGIADSFSAAIADSLPASPDWGNPWIIGDGAFHPGGLVRDCTDPSIDFNTLNYTGTPASNQAHVRGKFICAFFYRVQRDSGITPKRLLELVLNVIDRIEDYDLKILDVTDFRRAVLDSISASETNLRNVTKAVFDDMMEGSSLVGPVLPDNEPPPAGTPGKPTLTSSGFVCALVSGGWSTIWSIDWLPVPQASFYAIYAQASFRPYPDDLDVLTTTDTTAGAQGRDPSGAYIHGYVFGRSCNYLNCGSNSNYVPIEMLATCDI